MTRRKVPTQLRGQQRVSDLLSAANSEFSAAGYDSATMSNVAKRAKASIGSLYQFFPNKEALARELRAKYGRELDEIWTGLQKEEHLSLKEFADKFVSLTVTFVNTHSAFLALLDAPSSTYLPDITKSLQVRLTQIILQHKRGMQKSSAAKKAATILQICKVMMGLYARADKKDRKWVVEEFKSLLKAYLR
jgi:AcrR family transcriptional regulator